MDAARLRIKPIIRSLRKHYPQVRTALEFGNPLEILVATILAAQCTDERVNTVTPALFRKYPTAAAFARADRAELEREIRSDRVLPEQDQEHHRRRPEDRQEAYGGVVPDSMEELITLPGVARKTANIVLSAGYGKAEGIAVDTHAGRLSRRLGLSREEDPVKVERDLMALVPEADWLDFNFLLVEHGRAICQARQPKCPECFLRKLCPSAVKFFPELRKR